jgi:hypothetical protein
VTYTFYAAFMPDSFTNVVKLLNTNINLYYT